MTTLSERVACLAVSTFNSLPQKCKPRTRPDGSREWTPLCAMILVQDADTDNEVLTCASLATGTKCLPSSLLSSACGAVLHDCHAEVLALRGLSRFLLLELEALVLNPERGEIRDSDFLEPNARSDIHNDCFLYRLRSNVSVNLFTTTAPCGTASLELLIASKSEDNEPWEIPVNDPVPAGGSPSNPISVLHGHSNFSPSLLPAVRTKPSRPDAPPTYSKSCSDKLTISQFIGVLRFPADLFIAPVHLDRVIIPAEYYLHEGWRRSFASEGRLSKVDTVCTNLQPSAFEANVLPRGFDMGFEFAKPLHGEAGGAKVGNVSALYVGGHVQGKHHESLVNGVRQGFRQDSKNQAKQSCVCRNRMWKLGLEIAELVTASERHAQILDLAIMDSLKAETYGAAKLSAIRSRRAEVKKNIYFTLGACWQNKGDENWCADSG